MRMDDVEVVCAALEDKVKRAGCMSYMPILEFGSQVNVKWTMVGTAIYGDQ